MSNADELLTKIQHKEQELSKRAEQLKSMFIAGEVYVLPDATHVHAALMGLELSPIPICWQLTPVDGKRFTAGDKFYEAHWDGTVTTFIAFTDQDGQIDYAPDSSNFTVQDIRSSNDTRCPGCNDAFSETTLLDMTYYDCPVCNRPIIIA